MNTGFKLLYLLIYKGKVFIGSFNCRNDCMAVHFNCRKRRNAGVLPLELKLHYLSGGVFSHLQVSYDPCIVLICLLNLHSNSICCIIRTCGEKLHVPVALSLLYFCAVNTHTIQFLCFLQAFFGVLNCKPNLINGFLSIHFLANPCV